MQVSIRNLSEATLHPDCRWDGEYLCFEPYKNKNIKYVPIGDALISSQYGVSITMNEDGNGSKIYRMNEISNMMCNRNILKYAPINTDEIESYTLNDKDVLFNRTNSQVFVGRTGIFRKFSDENLVFASYLVRVVPNSEIIKPEYLTAFLNTKYGVLDVKRRARISINQSNVNAEELKRVEIPLVDRRLQSQVALAFDEAFKYIQSSEYKFKEAQTLLLSELGLTNWQPKHQLTFIKNYSDTEQAERFDAEYFQPKYEDIVRAIKAYKGGWDTLGNLCHTARGSLIPDSFYSKESGKAYIRGADFSGGTLNSEKMVHIDNKFFPKNETRVYFNEIVFSLIGSVGETALVTEEFNEAYISNNTGKITCNKNISPIVLQVLLKSIIGQMYFDKYKTQTAQPKISNKDTHSFVLPILLAEKQNQIQQKVTESFNLRKQSKHLLECAKKAVEMAIEQDEQTAIDWLEKQTKDR